MDFFKPKDVELLKSLYKAKYRKDNPEDLAAKKSILAGPMAKTRYWADEMQKRLGADFDVSIKSQWQIMGHILGYTWAVIYKPADEGKDIFFTIGIDGDSESIVYKIDYQAKTSSKLSPVQKQIARDCKTASGANWLEIPKSDFAVYTWDKLVDQTELFIRQYEEDYDNMVRAVWPHGAVPHTAPAATIPAAAPTPAAPTAPAPATPAPGASGSIAPFSFNGGKRSAPASNGGKTTYSKKPGPIESSHIHREMSDNLTDFLAKKLGQDKVSQEHPCPTGRIDVAAQTPEGIVFYEIKAYGSPLASVREALGQLLEYSYYPDASHASRLVVVTPRPGKNGDMEVEKVCSYVKHLRETSELNLYLMFWEGRQHGFSAEL